MLSGSALSSWALVEEPTLYSVEMARQMNCSRVGVGVGENEDGAPNSARMVDCLRQVPLARLVEARVAAPTFLNAFGPSVDGVVIRADFRHQLLAGALPETQARPKAPLSPPPAALQRNSKPRETSAKTSAGLARYDLLFGCVTGEALHG